MDGDASCGADAPYGIQVGCVHLVIHGWLTPRSHPNYDTKVVWFCGIILLSSMVGYLVISERQPFRGTPKLLTFLFEDSKIKICSVISVAYLMAVPWVMVKKVQFRSPTLKSFNGNAVLRPVEPCTAAFDPRDLRPPWSWDIPRVLSTESGCPMLVLMQKVDQ